MEQILSIAFEYGFILAGVFGFIGFLLGFLMDLFHDFGRG